MDTLALFQRLALALAIGLLIGLERGWRERDEQDGSRTAGIRTFGLIGLLGGVWGAMTPALGPIPLAIAGLALAGAITLFEWRESVARETFSVTSAVAGMTTFALGAYAALGDRAAAAAAGVATVALLVARVRMHEFLKRLTWPELRSAVLLLAMTFLLLPILPNRALDPWEAFNPYELWLMTMLIAAVSFAGYLAVRVFGETRGLILSAAAGALVSSTTVTVNNARLASRNPETSSLAVAICVAWMISLARMAIIGGVVNPALWLLLWPPIAAALVILGFAVAIFYLRGKKGKAGAEALFDNPLDLAFVLKFGALLAVVTVLAKIASNAFGEAGLLSLAAASGFVDVDPITLSAARMAGGAVPAATAAFAILLAGATNMVTKITVTFVLGGPRFGSKLALAGATAIAAGTAVTILTVHA